MDLEVYEPLIITNSLNDVKEEDLDVQYHSEYGDDEESDEFLELKLDEELLNLEKEQDLTDHDLKDNKTTLKKLKKQLQDLIHLKDIKTTLKKLKKQIQDLTDLKTNKMTRKKSKKHEQDLTVLKDKRTTLKKLKQQMQDLTELKDDKTTLKKLKKQIRDLTDIENNKPTLKKLKIKISPSNIKVEKKTEAPSQKQTVVQNKVARELRVVVERLKFTEDGKVVRPDRIKLPPKPKVAVPPPKREYYSFTMDRVEIKSGKNVTFGKTLQGNPQLHLHGYIYNRKAEGPSGTVYWKCWKLRCRSWVRQDGKKFVAPTKHELCVPFEDKKPKEPVKKVVHYCSFCDKSFGKKSTWIIHERTHTGEKPYVCEICNKRCAASGTLITHRLTHNNEKPFKCHKCKYGSITSTNLKQHIWRHHSAEGQKARKYKKYAKR